MLVWLFTQLQPYFNGFHVFQYITLRAILSALTALFIALFLGGPVIRYLTKLKVGQSIRTNGPQTHLDKKGTPTMGGVLVLIAIAFALLCWGQLDNKYLWICLFIISSFGAVGWIDDYKKVVHRNSDGLKSRWKYFWQSVFGLLTAIVLFNMAQQPAETAMIVPFFKNVAIDLGLGYVLLTYLVIVGTSNAVNFTDGLDGLAILPVVLVAAALGIFAYLTGHIEFSKYLAIPYVAGVGELVVVCAAIIGAGLGFLWFNAYPAQVFMGDVGALALGALLGTIAVLVRQELVLFVMGGIFVAETISVILQVGSFKLRGKRIFKMAPLHHHFELCGWPEPKVVVRFWLITVVLVLCGLATLKIR